MKFDAIQIRSAPEALVQQIIDQIQTGRLAPGHCLPAQRQLAKMFSVGMGTVREAIKILHALGYLNVIQGKGTFVSETLPAEAPADSRFEKAMEAVSLADLMKARLFVECEVAFLAAEEADAQNIERLREITTAMNPTAEDSQAFYDLDFEFHIAVAEAANNQALLEIVKLLVDRAHGHIGFMDHSLSMSMPFNVEKAVSTARAVVRHIEAGDGNRAREEMRRHLDIVKYELHKEFPGKEA
jgi:GntR family transcriptional repressor for pyruvate dehydrogenase complex